MQPYFFPYVGYFGLLAHVDEFVIFDCVQFPRRGRVHRTEVTPASDGEQRWLRVEVRSSDGVPVLIGNPFYVNYPADRGS